MIDVKLGVRKAFYEALNGNLLYNAVQVPVSDDIKPTGNTSPIYVILATQTGAEKNTFSGWASDETIDLDIIFKASTQASKQPLDLVAAMIIEIICPTITTSGLPAQPGMQFLNVKLQSDRYLSLALNASNTVERRILTFKLYVSQL